MTTTTTTTNNNYAEQMKELTAELFKALDQCTPETINAALQAKATTTTTTTGTTGTNSYSSISSLTRVHDEHVGPKGSSAASSNDKEEIVKSILRYFGPKRFITSLEGTPNLIPGVYETCQLPASSTTEDLLQHIDKLEVYPFLNGFLPENKHILRAICDALGLPERDTAEDMIKSIADEIMLGGSENFLLSLSFDVLSRFANDLSISLPSPVEHDKLVDMLMVKIFELEPYDDFQKLLHGESEDEEVYDRASPPPPTKKRKRTNDDEEDKERKPKKVKGKYVCPPLENIQKGITGTELRDLYNVTDLQEWCRQHGIPTSGLKKSILIRNILQYLDTGVVLAKAKRGKVKGKRRK